ncbi:MAG: DNA-processing protein DprA [Clostridia bacterium]|nr:DNA-processing protein DprA [Clostridia bacterium]
MEIKYNLDERALIFLSMFDLTYKKEQELLSLFKEPKLFLTDFFNHKKDIDSLFERGSHNIVEQMEKALNDVSLLNSYINNLNEKGIIILTPYSESYPESLKNIETPPFTLFCKGDISLLNTDGIAVVGTRMPTSYGRIITEQFCKGLVQNDFTIISGLAAGVDTISHRTTLENKGKTIAVLGGGFDNLYPAMNAQLAQQIVEKGLLISEYRPNFAPTVYTFPFRNRIIAAISKGVLITEAGDKSGSLHTKEFALEMGREVFAVPGNVTSAMSKGTNRLIRSAQGACVLNFEDIVCVFREKVVTSLKSASLQVSLEEQMILKLLECEERDFEQLQAETKLPTNKLNSMLTMLQIKGIIKQIPGNTYILA